MLHLLPVGLPSALLNVGGFYFVVSRPPPPSVFQRLLSVSPQYALAQFCPRTIRCCIQMSVVGTTVGVHTGAAYCCRVVAAVNVTLLTGHGPLRCQGGCSPQQS